MPKFNSKKTPGVTEGQMEGWMKECIDPILYNSYNYSRGSNITKKGKTLQDFMGE